MLPWRYPGSLELRSILLASDFSPASEKALRHALAIARNFDAELTLVHVIPGSLRAAGEEHDTTGQAITQALQVASAIERKLLHSGALRGIRYRSLVRTGDVCGELLRVIRHESIDLVVLGTHGRKRIRKAALGSVAEHIFRQASCPVLTVGPGAPPDAHLNPVKAPRPVLFVTDFSEPSLAALPLAISIAKWRHTQLILAYMLSPEQQIEGSPPESEETLLRMRTEAQAAAIHRLRQLTEPAELIVEPAFIAEFADPAEGILRVAAETNAQALVMGLGRRRNMEARPHLPWYTAYDVICRARCPVLTVRSYSP